MLGGQCATRGPGLKSAIARYAPRSPQPVEPRRPDGRDGGRVLPRHVRHDLLQPHVDRRVHPPRVTVEPDQVDDVVHAAARHFHDLLDAPEGVLRLRSVVTRPRDVAVRVGPHLAGDEQQVALLAPAGHREAPHPADRLRREALLLPRPQVRDRPDAHQQLRLLEPRARHRRPGRIVRREELPRHFEHRVHLPRVLVQRDDVHHVVHAAPGRLYQLAHPLERVFRLRAHVAWRNRRPSPSSATCPPMNSSSPTWTADDAGSRSYQRCLSDW